MNVKSAFLLIFLFITVFVTGSSIFIIDPKTQAIVLQFGEYKKSHFEPGLKVKIPFIQDVITFEKRIVDYDSPPIEVKTVDKKQLIVDAYVRYRIRDARAYYKSIQPANENGVSIRLDAMIPSSIKNVLGKIPLRDLLSPERIVIMKKIQTEITKLSEPFGLEIIDVRLVRTELPSENRASVYERFNQILIQTAKGNRADGEEKSKSITSSADRERVILLAEAQKKAQGIRGKGDAIAMDTINKAFGIAPEFYSFYRSIQSYKETIKDNTTLYLSADHPYFKYFAPKTNIKN